MNYIELIATGSGLIQSYLILRNKKSNWIFHMISNICLVIFSFQTHLYADGFESCVYTILSIIGLISWYNPKKKLKTMYCKLGERISFISIILLLWLILFSILSKTNDANAILDSFTTSTGLVATYLMGKKKIDTWIIWFINDITYVVCYLSLDAPAYGLAVMNLFWIFMAVGSFISWNKIINNEKEDNKNKKQTVYIGSRFIFGDGETLAERLDESFQAKVISEDCEKSGYIVAGQKGVSEVDITVYDSNITYTGPFYNENASNHKMTSFDCNEVVANELWAIKNADLCIFYFDENPSCGGVTELMYGLYQEREIHIIYKREKNKEYTLKSEHWFPITTAIQMFPETKVYSVDSYNEAVECAKLIIKNVGGNERCQK